MTVHNILTRPEHMGHTVNFRSSKNGLKAKRQTKPFDEWLIFKDTHEAIIPEDSGSWHSVCWPSGAEQTVPARPIR